MAQERIDKERAQVRLFDALGGGDSMTRLIRIELCDECPYAAGSRELPGKPVVR